MFIISLDHFAFALRRCRRTHYVLELSVRRLRPFFRTDLVTTISHEWLKRSRYETYRKYSLAPTDELIRFLRSRSQQAVAVAKASHVDASRSLSSIIYCFIVLLDFVSGLVNVSEMSYSGSSGTLNLNSISHVGDVGWLLSTGTSRSLYLSHVSEHFKHRCTLCGYMTSYAGRLKRHLEDCHSSDDQRPATTQRKPALKRCRKCGFESTNLVRHDTYPATFACTT